MNFRLAFYTAIGAACLSSECTSAQNPRAANDRPALEIRFYNLAHVSTGTLDGALQESSRILLAAGIQVTWLQGDPEADEGRTIELRSHTLAACPKAPARSFLVVRIVHGTMAIFPPGTLGFALPSAQNGAHVTIFYDRIEAVARSVPPGVAKILGNALGHEIGHVLLRSEHHAQNGIMKAVWTQADYRLMAIRNLEFPPAEAIALRAGVSTRSFTAASEARASLVQPSN